MWEGQYRGNRDPSRCLFSLACFPSPINHNNPWSDIPMLCWRKESTFFGVLYPKQVKRLQRAWIVLTQYGSNSSSCCVDGLTAFIFNALWNLHLCPRLVSAKVITVLLPLFWLIFCCNEPKCLSLLPLFTKLAKLNIFAAYLHLSQDGFKSDSDHKKWWALDKVHTVIQSSHASLCFSGKPS